MSENGQLCDDAISRERRLFASGFHLLVGLWVGFNKLRAAPPVNVVCVNARPALQNIGVVIHAPWRMGPYPVCTVPCTPSNYDTAYGMQQIRRANRYV